MDLKHVYKWQCKNTCGKHKWREQNNNNTLILIASTTMGKCNVKAPYVSTYIGRCLDFNKFKSSYKVRF